MTTPYFPFSAIVGQEKLKEALILNAINPAIGGVLIFGEKGTAKSTAVRGLKNILGLNSSNKEVPLVELPLSATEEMIVGTINIPNTLKTEQIQIEYGLLHKANNGIIYIDEVNLLEDHLVDVILDAAAMGVNRIEREGISHEHPANFILVGTMNPEEGELRPQLLDRFGILAIGGSPKKLRKFSCPRPILNWAERSCIGPAIWVGGCAMEPSSFSGGSTNRSRFAVSGSSPARSRWHSRVTPA